MSAADAREELEAAIRRQLTAISRPGRGRVTHNEAVRNVLAAADAYARATIDDDDLPPRLTRRRERLELLDAMCVHSGPDPVPPPGVITVAKAAELLGVSERTVLRYRRALAEERAS